MKDSVQKEFLRYLILQKSTTLNEIMLEFGCSKGDAIHLINDINERFKNGVIISDALGIYMTEQSKRECYKHLFREKEFLFHSHCVKERYNLILIDLILNEGYSSLQDLADRCLVSKNTILNDFKVLKNLLKNGLSVTYSRKNGYSIVGSEFSIKNLLVATVKDILNSAAGTILLEEKGFVTETGVFLLRKRLEKVESRIGIKLTDMQLDELPYILQLVIMRCQNHKEDWSFKIEKYDIKHTVEYPEIKSMFWDYEFLNENDLLYLSLQVLASNMVESALQIADGNEISLAIERFIHTIEVNLAIQIARKSELKEKLLLHMGPAIYRNLMGFQITNPLTDQFMEENHEIFNIVLKSVEPFEDIIRHQLSKEEVVYLSMIVLGWIYQTEETEKIFTGAVLCQSGTSVSKLLLVTLRSMFPEIDFVGSYSVRQFEASEIIVDFVFTTIPLKSDSTIFLVPSILDRQSRVELKVQVTKEMKKNNDMMTKKLFESIKDYINDDNYADVNERIDSFFEDLVMEPVGEQEYDNHFFNFSIDNINIVHDRIEWDDVVELSMKPLSKRNSVTQSYINETKKAFYDNYETMLIAQEVYLPHSKPEYGANKMDFQILIFSEPIPTPSGELVKVIVALSPDANNEHVETLIKLNNLFLDDELRQQIIDTNNIYAIRQILNKKGKS